MGAPIGQTAANLAYRPVATDRRTAGSAPSQVPRLDDVNPFNRADRLEAVRAGFGADTLSPGGAALQTLGFNLRGARNIVRTAEQIREASRVRQEEAQEPREESMTAETREENAPPETTSRPESAPQVRNFVQTAQTAPEATRPVPAPSEGRTAGVEPVESAVPMARLDVRV